MLRAAGPPPPEELRRDLRERRERIVRAALKALAGSDHESVKISEVARDANVALGTVYRYFLSKEHLFAAAFYEWQHAMKVRLEKGGLADAPEQDRLREVFHRTIKAFQVQPQFFRVLMVLQTTTDSYAARSTSRSASSSKRSSPPPSTGLSRATEGPCWLRCRRCSTTRCGAGYRTDRSRAPTKTSITLSG